MFCFKKKKDNIDSNNNVYDKDLIDKFGISLNISGKNNVISFKGDCFINGDLTINIVGNNNVIEFDSIRIASNLYITMGHNGLNECNNGLLKVGRGTFFGKVDIFMLESDSKCIIGEDCLFFWDVYLRCSDSHSIFDFEGNLLNYGGNIEIADHVWLGLETLVLKNTRIASDCVIGAKSVVTKSFTTPHCIIAGSPAKIVKEGITWNNKSPEQSKSQKSN